jgi:hypothetical protein
MDPTGTVGTAADYSQDADLKLATRGGPRFMQRLQQLGEATDRHEQAFAQLRLGQDAAAALKDASKEREAAETDRTAAAAELLNAKREAADILADANAQRAAAQGLRRDAEEKLRSVQEKEQQAAEAGEVARGAVARADAARRKADAREKDFASRIDRLQAVLREIE